MADLNVSATVPLEGLLIAFLHTLEVFRETMNPANRDAIDALHIKHLKRIDAIFDKVFGPV